MVLLKLSNLLYVKLRNRIIQVIIPLAIILLTLAVPQNDIKSLIVFVFLVFVFSIYKFDSRILIAYGVLLLVVTAVLTFGNKSDLSAQTAVLSYWILSSGIVSLLIDFYRKRNSITRASDEETSFESVRSE